MFLPPRLQNLAILASVVFSSQVMAVNLGNDLPPVGIASGPNHEVVIARAMVKFRPFNGGIKADPIEVILAPLTEATFDDDELVAPATISNSIMPFGNIKLTDLLSNNLVICGVGSDEQCTRARIRTYTTGVAGAGFWNTIGGYGMPLTAREPGGAFSTVGLGSANAIDLHETDISALNVLNLSDMYPSMIPEFDFRSDFRLAGAGSYSTTVVMDIVVDIDVP